MKGAQWLDDLLSSVSQDPGRDGRWTVCLARASTIAAVLPITALTGASLIVATAAVIALAYWAALALRPSHDLYSLTLEAKATSDAQSRKWDKGDIEALKARLCELDDMLIERRGIDSIHAPYHEMAAYLRLLLKQVQ